MDGDRGTKSGRDKAGTPTFTREQVDDDDFFDRDNGLRYEPD